MIDRNDSAVSEPRTVDEARDAIERSRERISSTLGALEDRIVEKKQELQEKADIFRPVKDRVAQRPLTAVAVAIGVGALLGSLGGGRSSEDEDRETPRSRRQRNGGLSAQERKELREWRQHRHERLEGRLHSEKASHDDRGGQRGTNLKNQLYGALTSAIGAAVTAKVKDMTAGSNNARAQTDGRYAR